MWCAVVLMTDGVMPTVHVCQRTTYGGAFDQYPLAGPSSQLPTEHSRTSSTVAGAVCSGPIPLLHARFGVYANGRLTDRSRWSTPGFAALFAIG